MPCERLRRARLALALTTALIVAGAAGGCSSGAVSAADSGASRSAPSSSTASPLGYSSTSFVVPFDLDPPVWLDREPATEQANFVTWEQPDLPAVRILAPVSVYRPGDSNESPVPDDYLGYLLGQAKDGAHFGDQTHATIAGQRATVVTATTDHSLDGSLGCPAEGTPAAACFGLQSELRLRIAVLKVQDRTLLIWLRTDESMPDTDLAAKVKAFDDVLASLRLSTRPVQAATTTPTTVLDGVYRMTVSWRAVKTAAARCVGGPEGTSPQVAYELDLDHGSLLLWVQVGGPAAKREVGLATSYRVDGNRVMFDNLTFDFSLTGRDLTLTNMQGGTCGDGAIFTAKPWTRS